MTQTADSINDMSDVLGHARIALACLDLTSLNDDDTEADITALCQRASQVDSAFGPVAALCVWPRFVALARSRLPKHIGVAAVANFPAGGADVHSAVADTVAIVEAGAQEVDVVLPWRSLMAGEVATCAKLLSKVRRACPGLRLKVILETGELKSTALITQACEMALNEGADFLKTSTGKTPTSATPEAAQTLLKAIQQHGNARVGFKASGGIRSVADAAVYIDMVRANLGEQALAPARFRFGASGLLNDIEAVLSGHVSGHVKPASNSPPSAY